MDFRQIFGLSFLNTNIFSVITTSQSDVYFFKPSLIESILTCLCMTKIPSIHWANQQKVAISLAFPFVFTGNTFQELQQYIYVSLSHILKAAIIFTLQVLWLYQNLPPTNAVFINLFPFSFFWKFYAKCVHFMLPILYPFHISIHIFLLPQKCDLLGLH